MTLVMNRNNVGLISRSFWIWNVFAFFLTFCNASEAINIPTISSWQSATPGKLLYALDAITNNVRGAPVDLSNRLSKIVKRNTDGSSEQESSSSAEQPYNYEQAYEDFVREYFSKLFDSGENSKSESVEQERAEAQVYNTKPLKSSQKSNNHSKKDSNCKTIMKNREECVICANPKSGEKSETCSFSTESEPVNYAFRHENNYKMERHKSEPSNENSSDEIQEPKTVSKRSRRPRRKSEQKNSSCTKKIEGVKVCYYCKNGDTGTKIKCFKRLPHNQPQKAKQDQVQKIKEKQQRIYKRTASYVIEKNFSNVDDDK
ncbi:uncharacterized protein LOC119671944 [Teleopsis dalmanni]|uniref:uncharacterized protein LOC119671944 n=1 Tax=Teleopsis dalmanni TaxID=139649 RepID=UPI0018CF5A84|nr:uncharacterized protein LOC119671944 [Teleopsis dalmanni]